MWSGRLWVRVENSMMSGRLVGSIMANTINVQPATKNASNKTSSLAISLRASWSRYRP